MGVSPCPQTTLAPPFSLFFLSLMCILVMRSCLASMSASKLSLVLLPPAVKGAKVLPEGVAFAVQAGVISTALTAAGVSPTSAAEVDLATPDAMNAAGLGMTVLVSCWE